MSYKEVKHRLEQGKDFYFPFGDTQDLSSKLKFLSDLRQLRLSVNAMYKVVDPNYVFNDKPLSSWYKEFKKHYAYETIFGFIMF